MSLLKNCISVKINAMLHIIFIIFTAAAVESLPGVATGRERGGGGLEVHINLMPPGVSKVSLFIIFWTLWAASYGRHKSLPNSIFCFL
jgi:hypothetical protein